MIRWIVNPSSRTVRKPAQLTTPPFAYEVPGAGEFLYDAPTAADAMMAGERHLLAKTALLWAFRYSAPVYKLQREQFTVVADRIEAQASDMAMAERQTLSLLEVLSLGEYDVWREGVAIVVLRGPK